MPDVVKSTYFGPTEYVLEQTATRTNHVKILAGLHHASNDVSVCRNEWSLDGEVIFRHTEILNTCIGRPSERAVDIGSLFKESAKAPCVSPDMALSYDDSSVRRPSADMDVTELSSLPPGRSPIR